MLNLFQFLIWINFMPISNNMFRGTSLELFPGYQWGIPALIRRFRFCFLHHMLSLLTSCLQFNWEALTDAVP